MRATSIISVFFFIISLFFISGLAAQEKGVEQAENIKTEQEEVIPEKPEVVEEKPEPGDTAEPIIYKEIRVSEEDDEAFSFDLEKLHFRDAGIKIGGRFTFDIVNYGHANERRSGFEQDTARIYAKGEHGAWTWRIEPDLVGTDSRYNLFEGWAAYEFKPSFRLKLGQFPIALGSEFASSEEHLPVVGYGFTSYIDGRYDVGLMADGTVDFFNGNIWYEAAATTGNGFGLEGFRRESAQFSTRIVYHPFWNVDPGENEFLSRLKGFFLGGAVAYLPSYYEPLVLTTPFESTVFATGNMHGDKSQWLHVETGFSFAALRFGGEKVLGRISGINIGNGNEDNINELEAWTAYASWNLTGENQIWEKGGWAEPMTYGKSFTERDEIFDGLWEIGARYSNADLDRLLFSRGVTTDDISSQEVRTFSLCLNWYPVRHIRTTLGWANTIADDKLYVLGNSNRDSSYLFRIDLNF